VGPDLLGDIATAIGADSGRAVDLS